MSGLQQAPPPTVVQGSSSVVKEGWLTKQGGKYKTWKKRWFILKNNLISYHKEIGKVSRFYFVSSNRFNSKSI